MWSLTPEQHRTKTQQLHIQHVVPWFLCPSLFRCSYLGVPWYDRDAKVAVVPEQRRPLHLGAHPDLSRYTFLSSLSFSFSSLSSCLRLMSLSQNHTSNQLIPSLIDSLQCTDIQLILWGQIKRERQMSGQGWKGRKFNITLHDKIRNAHSSESTPHGFQGLGVVQATNCTLLRLLGSLRWGEFDFERTSKQGKVIGLLLAFGMHK